MGQLPSITFISFGKPKSIWRPVLDVYEKRLAKATTFDHVVLREKGSGPEQVKVAASKLLEPHLGPDRYVIIFDERGKAVTSKGLATLLASARPKRVTAVIGTSYGLGDDVLQRSDRLINLGTMTLPHEIARVTALEQIYRAETILSGHPYHHV